MANRKIPNWHSKMRDIYNGMGSAYEKLGGEENLFTAKDCYVKGLDMNLYLIRKYQGQDWYTGDLTNNLRSSYTFLCDVCAKLPGEKNQAKSQKYRLKAALLGPSED